MGVTPRKLKASPLVVRFWVVIAIISVIVGVAYFRWERKHNLGGVPFSIGTTNELISTEAMAGITEGCGIRVHRMTEETTNKIRAEKLAFFSTARTGRDGGEYFRYEPWKVTPPNQGELLLRGLRCVALTNPLEFTLAKAIENAANAPGSFFSTGYEYDILVVPELAIVVVSFSG